MLYNILYVIYSHNQLISSRNFLQFSGAETMTTSLSTSPIQELEITLPNSDQVMSGNVLGL